MDMNSSGIPDFSAIPMTMTVTELNEYVKMSFEANPVLGDIYVKGEISNFKNHYKTGHYYFTLKDEGGNLRAVMFRSYSSRLAFVPEDGMKVIAHGRVTVFVRDGQYQLYVDSMEPDGIGALYIAFEQLKRKLEAEGLFAQERKRPLPKIPSRVGIITSPTGAAVRDMINIAKRRFPLAELVIYPALVQGPDAPPTLIAGLRHFSETKSVDVVIIGRGGGSIEDLWAFNDEGVARAVAACSVPVISAVGHETDFTICDFVADLRAPTPSAAAELALPEVSELKRRFGNVITHMAMSLNRKTTDLRRRLESMSSRKVLRDPKFIIDDRRMLTISLADKLAVSAKARCTAGRLALSLVAGKLEAMNPLSVLSRGYFAVFNEEGNVITRVSRVNVGDKLTLRAADGIIRASVTEVEQKDKGFDELSSDLVHSE